MRTHTASRHEKCWGRRAIITAGAAGVIVGAARMVGAARPPDDEEGVIVPEDLMKEHGVLNHCLLMYEEGIRRVQAQAAVSPQVFQQTADLVRCFVETYHEQNEEKDIFPVFQKAGMLTDLVATLLKQHQAGRALTAEIMHLSEPVAFQDPKTTRSGSSQPVSNVSACIARTRREKTPCSSPPYGRSSPPSRSRP